MLVRSILATSLAVLLFAIALRLWVPDPGSSDGAQLEALRAECLRSVATLQSAPLEDEIGPSRQSELAECLAYSYLTQEDAVAADLWGAVEHGYGDD